MKTLHRLLGCNLDYKTFTLLESFYLSSYYKETNCVYNLLVQHMEHMGLSFDLATTLPLKTLESKLDRASVDQLNLYLLKINLLAMVTISLRYHHYEEDTASSVDAWLAKNRNSIPKSQEELLKQYNQVMTFLQLPDELMAYDCFATTLTSILISTNYLCKYAKNLWEAQVNNGINK